MFSSHSSYVRACIAHINRNKSLFSNKLKLAECSLSLIQTRMSADSNQDEVKTQALGIGTKFNAGEQVGAGKMCSPAFNGNSRPILEILQKFIKSDVDGRVLEVAGGSGQHTLLFANTFKNLKFLPSAYEAAEIVSINAYAQDSEHKNIAPAHQLDASADFKKWGVQENSIDIIININMIHITPWACCQGLMSGSRKVLKKGGRLFMYGPYNTTSEKMAPKGLIDGKYTSEGNKSFDVSLRERESSWGVRTIEEVVAEAEKNNLSLESYHHMPENNFTLVFASQ